MNEWTALYQSHRDLRRKGRQVVTELRRTLRALGEGEPSVFDSHVHQRLQPATNPDTHIKTYRLRSTDGEYVATWNVVDADRANIHLAEAQLTVLLSLDALSGHLHQLTLMVEGTRRDGTPWTLAVHLPDDRETDTNPDGDRQGHGACSHAALHCHVGPTLDHQPKVRVPLPPMSPARLLEWLMSQVIPTLRYEAAPWHSVMAALKPNPGT